VAAGLSDEHVKGVDEAVRRCLIHNTLTHPPAMEIAIRKTVAV
jgi:hypothetical protein